MQRVVCIVGTECYKRRYSDRSLQSTPFRNSLRCKAPRVGLEPATTRLTQVTDAKALKVDVAYHIADCKPPAQGLALDRLSLRLFMAFDNGMVTADADNGHVVTTIKTLGPKANCMRG